MKIKLSKTKTLIIEVLDTSKEIKEEKIVEIIKNGVKNHIETLTRRNSIPGFHIKIEAIKFLRRPEISKIFIANNLIPEREIYISGEEKRVSLYFAKTWVEANFPPEFFVNKEG